MMLTKMRRRFIASAMAAMGAVTLVLLVAINLWNYNITTNRLDDTINSLITTGKNPYSGSSNFTLPDIFSDNSPESKYMTRYFAVVYDSDGHAVRVFSDYIATVSAQEALYYASDALSSGHAQGYYGDYRYCLKSGSSGAAVIFLNASPERQSMKTLFNVSLIVAAASLLAGFALVAAFSKKAIAPYVRNMQLQKEFITDAGHELKTPLTSISTSADVLKMENGDNEWVDNIQKQTVRMSKLVKNLVMLSRLDEGMPLPDKSDFSLSDAAWEAAEPFEMRAKAQGKSYSQNIAPDLDMTGDMAAVQQLISILLDNAFKYSDDGGEIRLSVYAQHKNKVIEVYNTCPPDSLVDIDRFFDRFYRADKSRTYDGGTGIGLAIARAIVQALGGSINAETADGKSIVFRAVI